MGRRPSAGWPGWEGVRVEMRDQGYAAEKGPVVQQGKVQCRAVQRCWRVLNA